MINDLTDEIFWIFTIGCCILFIMRLLSPPPRHKTDQAQDLNTLRPRRRSRRRRSGLFYGSLILLNFMNDTKPKRQFSFVTLTWLFMVNEPAHSARPSALA
ncbi:hypothetical protein HWX16_14280 [Ochrobactrum intermedium]|uniref:hypothetical protein n=1 Tax=Brucella intermedia TaxID=94625 RepID=UPI00159C02BD|nr:hypothetical protein [Brucella intermedia]NVM41493.1 hypothetical protein [Brucella intermedia]